jgi:hypothetical protein
VLRNDTRKKLAVRRALYELIDGIDSPSKRAIRSLAQSVFDVAGALDTIAQRIAYKDPKNDQGFVPFGPAVLRKAARLPDLVSAEQARIAPLSLPTALAMAAREIHDISAYLRNLDEEIREIWLTAPQDLGVRGKRAPRTLYLAVIGELARGGFIDREIAALVADERGGASSARAKRVANNLDRYKLHNQRTHHISPGADIEEPKA